MPISYNASRSRANYGSRLNIVDVVDGLYYSSAKLFQWKYNIM